MFLPRNPRRYRPSAVMFSLGLAAASLSAPSSRAPPARCARRCIAPRCSGTTDVEAIVHACLEGPTASLPSEAKGRVEAYVRELLRYNERTNVYSKSAYEHLPFHVQDSVVLAQHLATQQPSGGGVLDLGSGSGLPSVVLACVMPDRPVFAIESKSRKTRFLKQVSRKLELPLYTPLTQNVKACYAYSYPNPNPNPDPDPDPIPNPNPNQRSATPTRSSTCPPSPPRPSSPYPRWGRSPGVAFSGRRRCTSPSPKHRSRSTSSPRIN